MLFEEGPEVTSVEYGPFLVEKCTSVALVSNGYLVKSFPI